jgi:phenylpropionate dioxygenase-like ring-hydroxylating dioxygenase large terminal subunit
MGALMRQYWIPAAHSSELAADGEPVRLLILGEQLIGFRDTTGKVGIMDHRCPHRCASLFFGRNEEGGLRCVYHGWKFDADGNCLDMANVPPHQDFKHKVHAKAYKTAERANVVWVYMGDQANVPELPSIEATMAADDHVTARFIQRQCNWLQGLEGSIDTSHAGFLHGGTRTVRDYAADDPERFGAIHRDPEYVVSQTPCGTSYGAYRPAEPGTTYWRIAHHLFPFWTLSPSGPIERHVTARAWVPMDDTHTMTVSFVKKMPGPPTRNQAAGPANFENFLPNTSDWHGRWRTTQNVGNDFLVDRALQRSGKSFTGVTGVFLQDQMITESMGGIADRTFEHLAPSDHMIAETRRRLVRAARDFAEKGSRPPAADAPAENFFARAGHFIAPSDADWLDAYRERLAAARAAELQAAE